MPESLGPITIPVPATSGVFPLKLEYGLVQISAPQIVSHQFGHADAQAEQRFYLGAGKRSFQLSLAAISSAQKDALTAFFDARKGSYEAFSLNVAEQNGSVTTYTVRFSNPNLTLEQFSDCVWSGSIELVEVPSTTPTYTSSNTQTRFPNAALKTALLSQVQELIPLVRIKATDGTVMYISDRRVSVDGNVYQPRLVDWDGISQSLNGASDSAKLTLGNADRVLTQLVNSLDLDKAELQFSLFHVGSTTKINLWLGYVTAWSFDAGPTFQLSASDGLYQLRLPYPSRKITRQDGFTVGDQPVSVGGKKGIDKINATSVINDTAYGKPLRDVYVSDSAHPLPVKCDVIAGRDESEFSAGLGVIGRGPINAFGAGHTFDGKQQHGPGNMGLRRAFGGNWITGSETAQNNAPDSNSDKFALDNTSGTFPADTSILNGVSFIQIRTTDEKGIQPVKPEGKEMIAYVAGGLGCYTWSSVGVRSFNVACTNPIWIAINTLLYAKGKYNASVSEQEALFDVQAAVTAATLCDSSVTKLIGTGTEKQFTFTGIIEAEKPLRDWIQEILGSCLGYHTFSFGKLKVGIRFDSSVVEPFTVANIVHNSLQISAFQPEFNDLTVSFADYEYGYQQNALNLVDEDSFARTGEKIKANINLVGTSTKSQAARICTTKLREVQGGLTASEKLRARQLSFKTTVLALNTEPGMVCSMTHPDMPTGSGEFRVQSWTLNRDFSIDIQGSTTTDSMYNMLIGDKPTDVSPYAIPVSANAVPDDVRAIGAEPFLLESVANNGAVWTATLKYDPPSPIGPFSGVNVYYEDPATSGNFVLADSFAYNGTETATGVTRYGSAAVQIPLPLDAAKTWNIVVCPKSAFHNVSPSSARPKKSVSVPQATFSGGTASPGSDNLLINGSFEDGLDNWYVNPAIASSVSVQSVGGTSGVKFLRLTAPYGAYGEISQYSAHEFPVAPGEFYTVSFYVRANNYQLGPSPTYDGLASPQINIVDASGNYVGSIQGAIPTGTYGWKRVQFSGQVPATGVKAALLASWGKLVQSGSTTVDLDGITITRGAENTVTPFDYGADGTGTNDATVAIQAAIDGNSSLYLPPNTTFLVNTLTIANKNSFTLTGTGRLMWAPNQAAGATMLSCVNIPHLLIDGVLLNGNSANQPNAVGDTLRLTNCSDASLSNMIIGVSKGSPLHLTSTSLRVILTSVNISSGNTGAFVVDSGCSYYAYGCNGIPDNRVPIAAPPPVASLGFTLNDLNSQFGFNWVWANPSNIGTASGTIRQVRYWTKTSGVWVLDSDWITTGVALDLASSLTAVDGPFQKRSGEFEVEARIATINFENTKSTWVTTSARTSITALPIDSSLDNVTLNVNYNGSGYKVVSNSDGTMDVSVQYAPPYPQPPTRVTNLIATLPMIELADGTVLSYPAQPYTSNPALDPPGNLQVASINMDKPSAPTTLYFHVLSVSTNGQLGYKDHTLANGSSWIAVPITQGMIDGAVSVSDAPVAPTGISIAVDSSKPDVFSLTPTWTLPSTKGGNVGYAIEVQYLDTPTGTLLSTNWQAPTTADQSGKNTTSVTIGPFVRQSVDRYVFARVKAINGNGLSSAWVTMSGSGTLVPKGVSYQQPSDIAGLTFTVGGNNVSFTFTPAFTNPTDPAIIGYQAQARFFQDSGATTTPDSEWIDLGNRLDWTDKSPFGPFDRHTYITYARMRIRSLNSTGGVGNWITASTIGTVDVLTAPPAPTGVSFTIEQKTIAGSPKFRPTITVSPTAALGTTENYLREMRFWNDSALTNPDSDWIPLGPVYRTTLVSSTDWFEWDKVTKYVRVRVAGENKDGTPGSYVVSSTVTLSASGGLDLTAADTSKLKGLEVVSGKIQPKLDGTELVIDSNGVVSQNVVSLYKAQGYDTSVFGVVGGVFKQKAISTDVLLAGLVATNTLVVGGGTSNVTVTSTGVSLNSSGGSVLLSASGCSFNGMTLFNVGSLSTSYLQVGSGCTIGTTGAISAPSLSLTTALAVAYGGTGANSASGARSNLGLGNAATMNVGTTAGTVCAGDDARLSGGGSVAWSSITGKPTFGGASLLNVGTSSGTVCAGDDSRLANARTPTAHRHTVNTEDVEVRLADGSTRWIKAVSMSDANTGYYGS